jgi:hypothetical protein
VCIFVLRARETVKVRSLSFVLVEDETDEQFVNIHKMTLTDKVVSMTHPAGVRPFSGSILVTFKK